jgi:hypothetical protein
MSHTSIYLYMTHKDFINLPVMKLYSKRSCDIRDKSGEEIPGYWFNDNNPHLYDHQPLTTILQTQAKFG